jgi:hypothetical protein
VDSSQIRGMKSAARLLVLAIYAVLTIGLRAEEANPADWRALFDGHDTSAWRTFGGKDFPKEGWEIADGCLHLKAGGKGGELVTVDKFDNYELEWEWKLAPKANNGIKYLVTESRQNMPGPEYQMVDDSTMPNPKHKTATFYDVLPVQVPAKAKPIGEWNRSRLVVSGRHIEHWLNGERVLQFDLGSDEVKAALAQSKFKAAPGYGDKIKGHILLTNHHDEAWYRNIRIRELK